MNPSSPSNVDPYEQLTRYVLGESTPAERSSVEERLLSDPEYRQEFESLRDAAAWIGGTSGNEPVLSSDRRQSLTASASAVLQESPREPVGTAFGWRSLAASALLLITLVIVVDRTQRDANPAAPPPVPDATLARVEPSSPAAGGGSAAIDGVVSIDAIKTPSSDPALATNAAPPDATVQYDLHLKKMVTDAANPIRDTPLVTSIRAAIPVSPPNPADNTSLGAIVLEPNTTHFYTGPDQTLQNQSARELYALQSRLALTERNLLQERLVQNVAETEVALRARLQPFSKLADPTLGYEDHFVWGEVHSDPLTAIDLPAILADLDIAEGTADTALDADTLRTWLELDHASQPTPVNGVVIGTSGDSVRVSLDQGLESVRTGQLLEIYRADQSVATIRVTDRSDGIVTGQIIATVPSQSITVGDGTRRDEEALRKLREELERALIEKQLERYLGGFRRRKDETPAMMFSRYWGDNPFQETAEQTTSTFGMDVDTASYALVRRYLREGHVPPKAAVRTEEFVNAFPSNLVSPVDGVFGTHVEMAPSPFAKRDDGTVVQLLKIGIKARDIAPGSRKPLSLSLVIDVSGSMRENGRLELVKQAISTILADLRSDDRVGIVAFNNTARIVLESTAATDLETIAAALRGLTPGGSTNVEHGLQLGYEVAERNAYDRNEASVRNHRVVLFSDGVANVGNTQAQAILGSVAERRQGGMFLNTYGVGMGNHNDDLLEQLADRGDGMCHYIDSFHEAVRQFRNGLEGAFETVAKDAKIQVEFDPNVVKRFRQIGYENRQLAAQDFRNDAVDGGEVNAGDEVVALYEVELAPGANASVGTVRVRYQNVDTGEAQELATSAPAPATHDFDSASPRFRLSACVAAFAEVLRESYWARETNIARIRELATPLVTLDTADDTRIAEFVELLGTTEAQLAAREDRATIQLVEEYKLKLYRCECLREEYERTESSETHAKIQELEAQISKLKGDLRSQLRG